MVFILSKQVTNSYNRELFHLFFWLWETMLFNVCYTFSPPGLRKGVLGEGFVLPVDVLTILFNGYSTAITGSSIAA